MAAASFDLLLRWFEKVKIIFLKLVIKWQSTLVKSIQQTPSTTPRLFCFSFPSKKSTTKTCLGSSFSTRQSKYPRDIKVLRLIPQKLNEWNLNMLVSKLKESSFQLRGWCSGESLFVKLQGCILVSNPTGWCEPPPPCCDPWLVI